MITSVGTYGPTTGIRPMTPDPDHPTCSIGVACETHAECGPSLKCGPAGDIDEPKKVCGVPCIHDDQCKAGTCSDVTFPGQQGLCSNGADGLYPFIKAEDLCPATPVCGGDSCMESCAKLDVWNDEPGGSICDDGVCVLPCTTGADCPGASAETGGIVTCTNGRCLENGQILDQCYTGLEYHQNSDP
jgi:hypothetical protein